LKKVLFAICVIVFSCATGGSAAQSGLVPAGEVLVSLEASPEAKVEIIGDFSDWQPIALSFNPDSGLFEGMLELLPGEYSFKILENDRYLSPEIFPDLSPVLSYTQADGAGSTVGVWIVQ
jgi:hypothetical protein